MKHKVSELDGALLDATVAKADEIQIEQSFGRTWRRPVPGVARELYEPSRDWAHGGPIIERERIILWPHFHSSGAGWNAHTKGDVAYTYDWEGLEPDGTGPTPLIAAMRAFVASKFGDEVELP
jgi:hypothetical protein